MSGKGKDKGKAKAKAQASISKHQDELTSLENTDPEFYQFLKQNDTDLLDFGKHDIDALDDDDDEDDENSGMVEVNEELLNAVAEKAKNGSYSALKQLLGIFRAACIPAVDVADGKRASRYSVNTPEAYELSMTKTIEAAHTSFYKILGSAPYSSSTMTREAVQSLVKHAKWKKCEVLILSFFKSMLHSIASLADTRTSQQQSEVLIFLISSLELYVPLLGSMHRLANTVLKTLLGVWSLHNDAAAVTSNAPPPAAVAAASEILSSSSGSSKKAKKAAAEKANAALQQVQSTAADAIRAASDARSHAFLRVRQMALLLPGSIAEDCFRSIYLAFTRHCKSYNDQTSGSVNFMVACIVELYRTDTALAYQLAFIYVRQLGLFLRTAINKKTSEAVKQLVNWQFLNCLRLWTAVVSAQPQSNDRGLGELTYPLVQVMVGVMSITPSCVYIPCKFHLIGFMQQLAANCKLFIPTAPKLVEILEIPELQSKPTPSTEVAPKFSSIVRFAGDAVSKVVIRDAVLSEVVKLLRTEVEVYRYHPGLPEYTYLSSRKLRNFVKKCKNPKWKDLVRALIGHVDQLAAEAKKLRTKLSKSPMQIAADGADFEPLLAVAAAASSGPGKGGKHPQDANDAGLLPVDQRMRKMMYGAHTGNATSSVSAPTSSSVGTGKASRVSFADLRASSMPLDDDEEDEDEDSEEENEDDSDDEEEDGDSEGDSDSDDDEEGSEEEEEAPQPAKRKLSAAAQQQSQQKAKKGKPTPAPAPTAKAGKGRKQQAPRGAAVALSDEQDVVQSMTDGWSDDDN